MVIVMEHFIVIPNERIYSLIIYLESMIMENKFLIPVMVPTECQQKQHM